MALGRVPELRRISIITVVGTVGFLVLAAAYPRYTTLFAVMAILAYSIPYVFFIYVLPKRRRRGATREIYVRELTVDQVRAWFSAGRITQEEYDRMMRQIENQS